jgi:DNA modification methylase
MVGCPAGGIVPDPFMGTETTSVVAQELRQKYVRIELNEEYVGMAEERVKGVCDGIFAHFVFA